jgi:hypothetical protein
VACRCLNNMAGWLPRAEPEAEQAFTVWLAELSGPGLIDRLLSTGLVNGRCAPVIAPEDGNLVRHGPSSTPNHAEPRLDPFEARKRPYLSLH